MKSKGFTLIELLVVISIIALLLSILMPSLSRARAQAHSVQCMSNLRSMAMMMEVYLLEHEKYPSALDNTTGFTWNMYFASLKDKGNINATQMQHAKEIDEALFHCPGDKNWAPEEWGNPVTQAEQFRRQGGEVYARSYVMNDRSWFYAQREDPSMRSYGNGFNMNLIKRASETIQVTEHWLGIWTRTTNFAVQCNAQPTDPVWYGGHQPDRTLDGKWCHFGSANHSYFDGHVARMILAQLARDCNYGSYAEYKWFSRNQYSGGYSWCFKKVRQGRCWALDQ